MALLITGGLGYIGSHISILSSNEDIVIIDDLSNSNLNYKECLPRAEVITEKLSYKTVSQVFKNKNISGVIHLAGYKSVKESIEKPIMYYKNNIQSSIDLIEAMHDHNVNKLIFSSSATVYGNNNKSPLSEKSPTGYTNPYGHTKIIIEEIIKENCNNKNNFKAISLRYFNPIGADKSGLLSDQPLGEPLNLMPLIANSISGNQLKIFGNDYPTHDGTCIRDYIHVIDLAYAHLLSLNYLDKIKYDVINIGLGRGISVLDLIKKFELANNVKVNYSFHNRRDGDVAESFANNSKAIKLLNWKPKYNYMDMCSDYWNAFIKKNQQN